MKFLILAGLSTMTLEKSESSESRIAFIDDDVPDGMRTEVYDADISTVLDCSTCKVRHPS